MLGDRGGAEEVAEALAHAYARWPKVTQATPAVGGPGGDQPGHRPLAQAPPDTAAPRLAGGQARRPERHARALRAGGEPARLPRRQREVVVLRAHRRPARAGGGRRPGPRSRPWSTRHRALARLGADLTPALVPAEED